MRRGEAPRSQSANPRGTLPPPPDPVRWDNLTITAEEQAALPGYREPAVVRHFDAPEALDTRFYEVRAKSALNRVPERSRMPFRWTINPYRGCAHACKFCFARPTHTYLGFDAA